MQKRKNSMWISKLLIFIIKILIGAYPRWIGCPPSTKQRIYFANHTSHMDTLAIWAALPSGLRKFTRPVAAKDYWNKSWLRRYIAVKGFNAVFIERNNKKEDCQSGNSGIDPLTPLFETLKNGDSLIVFPEGTRNSGPLPGSFKSGLYHLATKFPEAELIPVYLENINRCMPKGALFPLPLICTVRIGTPVSFTLNDNKDLFLEKTRQAVIETSF